jgi:SagB-type dehydrogenase family enzyme
MRSVFLIIAVIAWYTCQGQKNEEKNSVKSNDSIVKNEIRLPPPMLSGNMSVEEALFKRRSIRNFKNEPLDLKVVSQLLWSVYGVTYVYEKTGLLFKTAPSAGATYPLEIYLLAGNVDSLKPGLYRYIPANHSIVPMMEGDMRNQLTKACYGQDMIDQAPLSIVFTAVYERLTSRYGKRGKDRYVCMDLGHSGQNLYLQATALSLGTCAIGAFEDKAIISLFKLPEEETPLYVMPVGIPK